MKLKLNKTIIGALHLAPLKGYLGYPGKKEVIRLALQDLRAFQEGGVDAVIFENNYDLPHSENISKENYQIMLAVGRELQRISTVPLGVNVLWNDFKSALGIAKELNLDFIRVPVLVDNVETSYGAFSAPMRKVDDYRKKIGANHVKIYADIHVKHSKITSHHTIENSAKLAREVGANAIIITGKWTGDSPNMDELRRVRKQMKSFPIIIGSGVKTANVGKLFEFADGAIVSTSLKEGAIDTKLTNLADWHQRISSDKVKQLMMTI